MKTKSPKTHFSPWSLLLLLALWPMASNAQTALDNYIREGLKNNAVLQQKNLVLAPGSAITADCEELFYAIHQPNG